MNLIRIGWTLASMAFLALTLFAPQAMAAQGDTRTTLYFGTTRFVAADDSTFGSTFGALWGYELQQNLIWSSGASFGFTDSERDVNGTTYTLQANTTTYQTGIVRIFNRMQSFEPFIGGGVSFLSYDLDFEYPGSKVGKTSGLGPGIYTTVGVDIHITRSIVFIPAWVYSANSIVSESGEKLGIYSGGLQLSLRVGL